MASRSLTVLAALVAALAILGAVGCGGGDEDGEQTGDGEPAGDVITVAGEEANFEGRQDVTGEESVNLELGNFFFGATVLVGEPGQTITVNIENTSSTPHTFTLRQQDVDEVVDQKGDEAEAEVTFPDSGEVLFICRFHARQGMRGGLRVSGGKGATEGGGTTAPGDQSGAAQEQDGGGPY